MLIIRSEAFTKNIHSRYDSIQSSYHNRKIIINVITLIIGQGCQLRQVDLCMTQIIMSSIGLETDLVACAALCHLIRSVRKLVRNQLRLLTPQH